MKQKEFVLIKQAFKDQKSLYLFLVVFALDRSKLIHLLLPKWFIVCTRKNLILPNFFSVFVAILPCPMGRAVMAVQFKFPVLF